MDRLIEWHREHCDLGVSPEVEAAWLHHRFTQIHPFQDGNGRVARALASLVLIRDERFAFSVAPEQKNEYIDTLELADKGNLVPLIDFITKQQQREFGQALSVAQALADEQQIFAAALAKATSQRDARTAAYADVKNCGDRLMNALEAEFIVRRDDFNTRMNTESLREEYHAHVFRPRSEQRGWYFAQIVECARTLGYFADYKVLPGLASAIAGR